MPLVDSQTIIRLFNQGEVEISVEQPFLVDRLALNIQAGVNTYDLPDYVLSIRRCTFLGIGLDPLPRRNQREVFQNSTQVGTPFWMVYNNVGLNQIILFPCPGQNVAQPPDGTDLFLQSTITTSCIVEFYRTSDNNNFIVPPIFRRQLLKKYVAANVFMVDNANVNIRISNYYAKIWQDSKTDFFNVINDLIDQPRRLVINDFQTFNWWPGSPVLPINRFGISVEEGY